MNVLRPDNANSGSHDSAVKWFKFQLEKLSSDEEEETSLALASLNDPDEDFRCFCVDILGDAAETEKNHQVKDALISALSCDPSPRVRSAVLSALVPYVSEKDPEDTGLMAIQNALKNDPSAPVRSAAEEVVGIVSTESVDTRSSEPPKETVGTGSGTGRKLFISIAGNVGSGKSSLTKLLSNHFGWIPFFESVDDNPYLSDFYCDMKRWSFHLQVYFLSNRFINQRRMLEIPESVVQDRSIYEDVEVFARNLHEMGKMDNRDYDNYRDLFTSMVDHLTPPDLLIYLHANTDALLRRIRLRGRSYEQGISRGYLDRLNASYEDWIKRYDGRLLVIESDALDLMNSSGHVNDIVRRVEDALACVTTDASKAFEINR